MNAAFAPFWGWPFLLDSHSASAAMGGGSAPRATNDTTHPQLTATGRAQLAAPARDAAIIHRNPSQSAIVKFTATVDAEPYSMLTDGARELLRRASLSLTALSTRAQAYFAQLAAALAYDRALRDAKRAQEAFEAALQARPRTRRDPLDEIPFAATLSFWWQAAATAAAFWKMSPVFTPFGSTVLLPGGVAAGTQIAPPAKANLPLAWPWDFLTRPQNGAETPWQTVSIGVPGATIAFAWDPAWHGFWGRPR
jgi:hypothetical protein